MSENILQIDVHSDLDCDEAVICFLQDGKERRATGNLYALVELLAGKEWVWMHVSENIWDELQDHGCIHQASYN